MTEEWRAIPSFPGYEASDAGNIRNSRTRRLLKSQSVLGKGYARWGTTLYQAGKGRVRIAVARLVCEAFHGAAFSGAVAAHLDGDTSNNRLSNVYWATAKENTADSKRHGTWRHGSRHVNAKLDEAAVLRLRADRAAGATYRVLAARYGISAQNAWSIVARNQWRHV